MKNKQDNAIFAGRSARAAEVDQRRIDKELIRDSQLELHGEEVDNTACKLHPSLLLHQR